MTAQKMFDLSGKTALVTGAGSGIGFAIAECFAENGARVVLAELSPQNLEQAVERLTGRGLTCVGEVVDVAHIDQIARAADRAATKFGSLDIVAANAGISAGPGPTTEQGTIEAYSASAGRRCSTSTSPACSPRCKWRQNT